MATAYSSMQTRSPFLVTHKDVGISSQQIGDNGDLTILARVFQGRGSSVVLKVQVWHFGHPKIKFFDISTCRVVQYIGVHLMFPFSFWFSKLWRKLRNWVFHFFPKQKVSEIFKNYLPAFVDPSLCWRSFVAMKWRRRRTMFHFDSLSMNKKWRGCSDSSTMVMILSKSK